MEDERRSVLGDLTSPDESDIGGVEPEDKENLGADLGVGRFTGESQQIVSFSMGDEEYGVDISQIHEIVRMREITHIPEMPDFIEGVMNLRGNVVPVVDLRRRFHFQAQNTKATRIIVVDTDESTVGLVVDSVSEVLRLSLKAIEPPPPVIAGVSREYIKGVGKLGERLIILLDLDKVLSFEEQSLLLEVD